MVKSLRLGLVLGLLLALWHAAWSALVAFGLAQKVIDFVFWMHFIVPPFHIEPFDLARACILVGVTFGVGLVVGTLGGVIWNLFHRG